MDLVFTYQDGSQELYHHGVKGMKWGVRKRKPYVKNGLYYSVKSDKMLDKTARLEKKLRDAKAAGNASRAMKLQRKRDKAFTRLYDNVALDNPRQVAKEAGLGPAKREANRVTSNAARLMGLGIGVMMASGATIMAAPALAVAASNAGFGMVAAGAAYSAIKSKRINDYSSYARADVNVHKKDD